ncbi:hypothetical protein OXB_2992 [Bacillus sp. OxB-1]|uniref:hypothetical protein n=1 Tax=Bacillus sp. (strain OxB-1) TaxID=98228 RepID=UPI000581E50D|nr:hypothetical protein [Bacillus sp. OxB-1]BAQ11462.1 hypothetical protein OXB_2992 [Bacillus sp. OxB-1]
MRTLQDQLKEKGFWKGEKTNRKQARQKKTEKFTERELQELMGIKRDIYKRVNGAFRRK